MKIMLLDKTQIVTLILPNEIYGNYWITNAKGENLINVEAIDGRWVMKSNTDVKIYRDEMFFNDTDVVDDLVLTLKNLETDEDYDVYCSKVYDDKAIQLKYNFEEAFTFYIGNNDAVREGNVFPNWISYDHSLMAYNQLQISYGKGKLFLRNLNSKVRVYVNNGIFQEGYINSGDIIFVLGFRFSIIRDIILLINPSYLVKYDTSKFTNVVSNELNYDEIEETPDSYVEVFDKKDYFLRPPRFSERVEKKSIVIDPPPNEFKDESLPAILTMGPMVVMGMGSCVTGVLALLKVMNGEATWRDSISSIITAFAMIAAMVVFPSITKAYNKNLKKKKEKQRQKLYSKYLDEKRKEILDEMHNQARILTDTNLSLSNVADIINYKKRNLWERLPEHPDFLELRLGIGSIPPNIELSSPEEHFTLDEDNLKQKIFELKDEMKLLTNVPVTVALKEKFATALIGNEQLNRRFIDGLILQCLAYHSWINLKIVILTNEENAKYWEKFKNLPYCWDNEKSIRFFGTNSDDILKISTYLSEVLMKRKEALNNKDNKTSIYDPVYLIITDDVEGTRNVSVLDDIMKTGIFLGFSILFSTSKLNSLSHDVTTFINISQNEGGMFENELVSDKRVSFVPDYINFDLEPLIYTVSNIPIDLNEGKFELPTVYSFLEMYNVSNVKQLNSFNRWKSNDPTKSLSVPVGINQSGDLFKLDLHEKVHGPHGLVAGMTGSGKSEFIITYILSMAVNFHPNEVNFVLIDYKGGGLAGAFENKETGVTLPHLAGTITNLDVGEINRSLSSLQSELKRRQAIFNEARDITGESTIDIYKYQKLYREGKVNEPVSHLFIISDEFAELKAQQPEFMSQLISTARIGRSLGVHLILATQKPSGVVDDQIWSNSKFRVCLKVQDKADSNDMIKSPDAAMLKETGRFYLQVGYNEFFALGQSAWCGAPYYEADKRKKKVNTSIDFVDNIGSHIKNVESSKNNDIGVRKGEELPNVLNYIVNIANENDIKIKKLWLPRIPAFIYVDNLRTKYNYQKEDFVINPILGEYDAPSKQQQGLLTIPISATGNTIVYGMVGSGKDDLVSTVVYSLITTYSVDEINIYIMDFGAETLRLYKNAPQIGGVVFASDKDKVANLFKLIKKIIDERKKLFIEYSGNYDVYIKNSGKTIPSVLLIINNYEAFSDNYGADNFEDLVTITREGVKYGVYVLVTVSGTTGIRSKLSQNFANQLALQMSDDYDYRSIVGRTEIFPAKINGRGLVKLDQIYEFQTAYPAEPGKLSEKIKILCEDLNKTFVKSAMRIPELPEVVTTQFVKGEFGGLSQVPIGVEKVSLNVRTIDIKNQVSTLISAQKITSTKKLLASLIYELSTLQRKVIFVFDAERLLKDEKIVNYCKYYNSSFETNLEQFGKIIEQLNDIYVKSDYDLDSIANYEDIICIFVGIDKLKTILADKFNTLFADKIESAKKLLKFNFLFVDSVDVLKKMEYDGWYKSVVNSSRGIWIGSGISEQGIFRLNASTRSLTNILPDSFGYDIVGGNPCLVKFIETYEQEDEYDTL